jgi:hypothetical protein
MKGCSGRLRKNSDVEGQPLKGHLNSEQIAVSLKRYPDTKSKRYPDTKPKFFRNLLAHSNYNVHGDEFFTEEEDR